MSSGKAKAPPVPDFSRYNLGALLRDPEMWVQARIQLSMEAAGFGDMRPSHGKVFQFIGSGCRVTELAERAMMTKQSMAELVAHLQARHYVESIPDPRDRRAKLIRLTRRGKATMPVALAAIRDVEREWAAILGQKRLETLRQLLGELRAGLSDPGLPPRTGAR